MTSRERLASGRASGAARPVTGPPETAPRPTPAPETAATTHPWRWEDLFQSLSATQQRELLTLAARQGVLYAHQLPADRNGTAADAAPAHLFLTRVLGGEVHDLEPVRPSPVGVRDTALDAAQRDAVAKALATTDLCLIRGLPGTGKSRVVAELVHQAVARGERVLLSARCPAALDRVLELTGAADDLYALRLLGPEERPEMLPAASRALTLAERLRHLSGPTLRSARQALADREPIGRRLRQDEPAWALLGDLADRLEQLQGQEEALVRQRPLLAAEVEQEDAVVDAEGTEPAAGSFRAGLAACVRQGREAQDRLDKALGERRGQLDEQKQQQAAVQAQLDWLRPLAEARQQKRWWTGAWWQALRRQDLPAEVSALEDRQRQIETALTDLEQTIWQLAEERDQATQALQAERRRRREAETARRQADLDQQLAALRQERHLLHGKWQATFAALAPDGPRPSERTRAAVQQGREAWQKQVQAEEQQTDCLRHWVACLEETGPWPARLRGYANVVAGTTAALAGEVPGGDAAAAEAGFDLLVLQEADQITEADFVRLARRARRWVLVGAPPPDRGEATTAGLRKSRAPAPRPELFERLWYHLHWEPRQLPYAWVQENERLCCRLRPVAPEQRTGLESESVADSPDIELRILSLPGCPPQLAEVVFPPSRSIAEAKAFIFQELEELAVQAAGHGVCWVEEPRRLVLRLVEESLADPVPIVLEPGVRELVGRPPSAANGTAGAAPWQTCCLEFDREAGWDRPRAERWVQQHLGVRDLGRTARLDVPYRMHPDLAVFLSHLLFGGDYRRPEGGSNGSAARVEFVPVPPLRDRAEPGRGAPAALPRKGGAGLEVDLADPRQRSRLPGDVGAELPNAGFVNYREAQAVVRTLEALAADLAAAVPGDGERPHVAVIALYPAQVELIRRLVRQSPSLTSAAVAVEVDTPAAFRERECPTVLLSLTRSHSHRAITFGEGPEMLALALTRARSQLLLFGDAGALVRRSQWEGPLEHLDEAAAARERECVTRLVDYLQGQGSHPGVFRLHEGMRA